MPAPAILDERASLVRRVPSQSGQVMNVAARSTKARTCGCRESTSLDSIDLRILVITPS